MTRHARDLTPPSSIQSSRRRFLTAATAAAAAGPLMGEYLGEASQAMAEETVLPPEPERPLLLSCKLTMIAKEADGKPLTVTERLALAKAAGFDGVDFDEAGDFTVAEARQAVQDSGMFVHNAINHAHWRQRLTSPESAERETARDNLAHCIRVSHAAGGVGVLIVVGHAKDGEPEEVEQRCFDEMNRLLPLAAALGQPILIENVWNQMFYEHNGSDDQSAEKFVAFIDRFQSPWVGLYYDIGNHWKYGQPGDWIRQLGHRCVKLDVKGFSREKNGFTDIGAGDLPWSDVRDALREINFHGWATAEVGGGGLDRLKQVRDQMETALITG